MCWSEVSNEHWLAAGKRIVGHLFLVWLAANLNPHPCPPSAHRQEIHPRRLLALHRHTTQHSNAARAGCDGCAGRGRGGEAPAKGVVLAGLVLLWRFVSSAAAGIALARVWLPSCVQSSCFGGRVAPAFVCMRQPHRERSIHEAELRRGRTPARRPPITSRQPLPYAPAHHCPWALSNSWSMWAKKTVFLES